jgi:DNA-binding SARP family transcriptional activator
MAAATPTTSALEIRLLGELTVLRGGVPCPLPSSKKTRALLGYLVSTGRPHSRERLCELFWEGPDDPRGGLRWALSKIRPLLDEGDVRRLQADREHVGFEPAGAVVDLAEVRALAKAGIDKASLEELRAGAARFRGRFLEGHDLSDCVHFYTWCVGEREQLRSLQVSFLMHLIERLAGSPDEALKYARALVSLDPLAESSHVRLIRLLGDAGRTREALEEYRRCRRILSAQIGAKPSIELEQLRVALTESASVQKLTDRELAAPATPVVESEPAPSAGQTPLVGRRSELSCIESAIRDARSTPPKTPAVLLFVGDPGAGKSRMLEELAARARSAGGALLSGRAFEAEGVRPYGAWLDALRTAPDEQSAEFARGELGTLLDHPRESQTSDRTLLFEAIGRHFRKLIEARGLLVLILDDIQWLDESSAALLHFLGRSLRGERVVIAAGARPGELSDNAAALRAVRALERERNLTRVAIEPLDPEQTASLHRQIAPSVDAGEIWSESRGNPLFVIELARAALHRSGEVPENLAMLITSRLERLDGDAQTVLPWAAALGRAFDVGVLIDVTGLPATALLGALADLERHAVVRATGPSGYDFVHDLVRRAAYEQMSDPRRRLVHLQIARSLWAGPGGAVRAGDVVHHAALAGDHELAATACIAAGTHCIRLFAYADAWELSRRGLEHAKLLPLSARLPLQEGLLGLRAQSPIEGAREELDAQLTELSREAEIHGMPEVMSRAQSHQAMSRWGARDDVGAREVSLRRAETGRVAGSSGVLHLLGGARCLAHLNEDMTKVRECLDDAVRMAGPDLDLVDFFWTRGLLERYRGDYGAALADLERALAHNRRDAKNWEICICLDDIVLTALESGKPGLALAYTPELIETARKVGDGALEHAAAACDAIARIALEPAGAGASDIWGRLDAALDRIRAADGQLLLSTCSNFAAELALAGAENQRALAYADQAIRAALTVRNRSQAALGRALAASAAAAIDDEGTVIEQLEALERESHHAVSARAESAVAGARALRSRRGA